jgi:LmbE family N-acetylglucosaminyl deacetylase
LDVARKKQMNISHCDWIYISPHLDDAALSCGGLIWEQAHSGDRVSIWTICAGFIPPRPLSPFAQELHTRWQTGPEAVQFRREEDHLAAARLGAEPVYLDIPDCIYRFRRLPEGEQPLIQGEADLQGAEPESDLVERLAQDLRETLSPAARVVCPMALGGHVDHRLARTAAEHSGLPLYYYADYPYVLRSALELAEMEVGAWKRLPAPVSTPALTAWLEAVSNYSSQISTFWSGVAEMKLAVHNYWAGGGGRLWQMV